MPYQVLYKEQEYTPKGQWVVRDLEDILQEIRSNKTLQKATDAVRNAPSKLKKDKIKAAIPSFFPCLDPTSLTDHVSNGVMQFDLEHHDHSQEQINQIKQIVDKYPHTVYSFLSPSGGLKFAVQTDFHTHFKHKDDRYKPTFPK
jgi:hypothetical protein